MLAPAPKGGSDSLQHVHVVFPMEKHLKVRSSHNELVTTERRSAEIHPWPSTQSECNPRTTSPLPATLRMLSHNRIRTVPTLEEPNSVILDDAIYISIAVLSVNPNLENGYPVATGCHSLPQNIHKAATLNKEASDLKIGNKLHTPGIQGCDINSGARYQRVTT